MKGDRGRANRTLLLLQVLPAPVERNYDDLGCILAIGKFGSRQVPFLPWKSISLLTAL